jgi:hypothetical protein
MYVLTQHPNKKMKTFATVAPKMYESLSNEIIKELSKPIFVVKLIIDVN